MSIFQNTWFVGICTGIISGILVFFLTKWIMDRRSKSEYYKQIDNANQAVVNSLKPYIADKGLPRMDIFGALIASVSRLFGVNVNDMYSIEIYCEELIREIMSDIYVSNDKKQEYSLKLAEYKNMLQSETREKEMDTEIIIEMKEERYSSRMRTFISAYLSVLTALSATLLSVFTLFEEDSSTFWFPFDKNPLMWIPTIIIMMILITIVSIFLEGKIGNKKKK